MNPHETLVEEYEEALFAVLMSEVMQYEGKMLERENRRIREEGLVEITPELDARCRRTMADAFEKIDRAKRRKNIRKGLHTLLIAAAISALLFSTAYATVPDVRSVALNFISEVTERYGAFFFGNYTGKENMSEEIEGSYVLSFIPENFEKVDGRVNSVDLWEAYAYGEQRIDFRVMYGYDSLSSNVDTEESTSENIMVSDYEGYLITKNGGDRYLIYVFDKERQAMIEIVCRGVQREVAMEIANGLKFYSE